MTTKTTTTKKPATAKKRSPAKSTKKKAASAQIITLAGNLGIAGAETLHSELNQALENHGDMVLDGENLAQVDASIVQLLFAFIRDAHKNEIPLTWNGIPESLQETSRIMGMTETLGFDV